MQRMFWASFQVLVIVMSLIGVEPVKERGGSISNLEITLRAILRDRSSLFDIDFTNKMCCLGKVSSDVVRYALARNHPLSFITIIN